jgi:hypothetical protein
LINDFVGRELPVFSASINGLLVARATAFFQGSISKGDIQTATRELNLESINIALAIRCLGNSHVLPPVLVEQIFGCGTNIIKDASYFHLVSCLWYVRSNTTYSDTLLRVIAEVMRRLEETSELPLKDSATAHLFLDAIACPYIPDSNKKKLLHALFKSNGITVNPQDYNTYFAASPTNYWFIDWNESSLLNILEKKELKRAY